MAGIGAGLYLDVGLPAGAAAADCASPLQQLLRSSLESPPLTPHGSAWPQPPEPNAAPFAAGGSEAACAQYLEPALRDLGLAQWRLPAGSAAAALNSLHELVGAHQELLCRRDELQEELQKLRASAKASDRAAERLQQQCEQKAQEAGGLQIKLRQLDAWCREEAERWGAEREELAKKCAALEQRHVQFQHELRRRDGEYEKLQKQLAAHLACGRRGAAGAAAAVPAGKLTMASRSGSAPASRCNSVRAGAAAGKGACALGPPPEAHEAGAQDLSAENAALRRALMSLEREHKDLLNSSSNGDGNGSGGGKPGSGDSRSPDAAATASAAAADPKAALQQVHRSLQALSVRKQRIAGPASAMQLHELQQHAQSANERLLLAKLVEASRIMEEQESALAMALRANLGACV